MEQRFAYVLRTLQRLLLSASEDLKIPIRFALIGGLAVSAWGVVRATEDIDFLADSNPSPLRNPVLRDAIRGFLETRGCTVEWRAGEPDDPIPLLLRVEMPQAAPGLAVDVLWAHKRWQREALMRALAVSVSRMKVFILHPEDLVIMKLEAGGPQDLLDVEVLLSNPPAELDVRRLKKKAAQLRLGAGLERCLQEARGKLRRR